MGSQTPGRFWGEDPPYHHPAGLLDEMLISLVPVFLGGGARLFDRLGDAPPKLEPVEVVGAPGVTHIRYRVER